MKAQDIVDQLSAVVPLFTDGFSDKVAIDSIVAVGTLATVTTSVAHNLVDGQNVAITGATAPVSIDSPTFIRVGSSATFETLQDHDLTLSERDKANGGKTISISGAAEVEFNGTFSLLQVVNRRKLIISVVDSGPTTISGSPIVVDAAGNIFNVLKPASNLTATTFEYTLDKPFTGSAVVDNAYAQVSIRILSVLSIDQYLDDVYTRKLIDDDVLVVSLGNVVQSKNRNEQTDAATSSTNSNTFSATLIQPFAVYIIQNTTDDLTGSESRDKVESEYVPAIFKAICRAKFDTGFSYSQYRATFLEHGVYAYSDNTGKNKAIYAHEIVFEQLALITGVDAFNINDTVALRDICYTLTTSLGSGELTADIDLDEEPL